MDEKKISKDVLDSVFHAYDIRGLAEKELSEDFYYALGRALVTHFQAKKVVLGRDFRPDSLKYQKAMIEGVLDSGCSVVDIGEIATEMLYYATGSDESYDCGAVITASHNPAEWNGCKIVGRKASAVGKDSGLNALKDIMLNGSYIGKSRSKDLKEINIYPEFKAKVRSFLDSESIEKLVKLKLKIAIDAGNGIGGKMFDYIFGDIPMQVYKMYFDPDGSFPNHTPDPLKEENVAEIKKIVIEKSFDLGIAIDGDADRVFFIDNKGRNPNGAYTGAIFAKRILEAKLNPAIKEKVIHDPRLTWSMIDTVKSADGIPVISKAGHSYFKEIMRNENVIYGAEVSSHFFYRDFYFADSGMITIALMLKFIADGLNFSEEVNHYFESYPNSGEINFEVADVNAVLGQVEKYFTEGYSEKYIKIEKIDGLSIDFENWRFNLRGSNTQPLIRLNVEARVLELVNSKRAELEKIILGK